MSSVTGPGGCKTAGFIWGFVAHLIPVPEGRFPLYRATLGMWAPAPGTELSWELGGSTIREKQLVQ